MYACLAHTALLAFMLVEVYCFGRQGWTYNPLFLRTVRLLSFGGRSLEAADTFLFMLSQWVAKGEWSMVSSRWI
jgi:hypothetical protein